MASILTGLFRTLTWPDFGTPRPGAPPGPDETATAAFTFTQTPWGGLSFEVVPGSQPPQFRLRDDFTVSISFDGSQSFVMAWLFTMPKADQDRLLNHEQGHFNVSALLARDFFLDVMQLKAKTFASVPEGTKEFNAVKAGSLDKVKTVQDLYDVDSDNSNNAAGQAAWDGFRQRAFTEARPGGGAAGDGTPLKVRLLDVLRAAGKSV